jgi:hypothetical protein
VASDATPRPGQIGWIDLTVPDADAVRDFYRDATGWTPAPVSMGDYQDYCMNAANGQSVAGICHARGDNTGLPAVWMIYIVLADLDAALQRCEERGGKLLGAPKRARDGNRFCAIQDPAGAIAALYESRTGTE